MKEKYVYILPVSQYFTETGYSQMTVPSSAMTELESKVREYAGKRKVKVADLQRRSGRSSSVFYRVLTGKATSAPLVKWLQGQLGFELDG